MKSERGVTAVELMIVIGLIGVIAAMAIPATQRTLSHARLSSGSTLMVGAIEGCRDKAANNGIICIIEVRQDDSALTNANHHEGAFRIVLADPETGVPLVNAVPEIYNFRLQGKNKLSGISIEYGPTRDWEDIEFGYPGSIAFGPDGLLMDNAGIDAAGNVNFRLMNKRAVPNYDANQLVIDRGGNVRVGKAGATGVTAAPI